MAQQTSYNNNPAAALPGLVRWEEGTRIETKIASGAVGIGLLGAPGTQSLSVPSATTSLATDGSAGTIIALPSGISDDPVLDSEFIGIPILETAFMQTSQIGTAAQGTFSYSTYVDKMAVSVLRKGVIWVFSAQATTQYGAVYVYTTAQTNNPLGQFGFGTGTGKAKFTRGQWLMTTSGAGLSLLEVW
jgi:hypothetical protein